MASIQKLVWRVYKNYLCKYLLYIIEQILILMSFTADDDGDLRINN